ncbi:MAG TPA: AI-2E family transporter [Sphingorhabdus lacus]|jgi:predicted PurR-regulated permease PerM|uniref:AI-2E family transporter n=1 Tax=Sphingorhabdus lacus TaxID=392610 RepID=A0A6I6LAN4_9SPHN|nr:AI-2E family transporter [Sphingorhabdus lacus]QGY81471.1 AI-2E family transporter [Sphingorhabdus lacus]HNW18018.1 AI-2E family transporter [Sphingorhabdus lacus]HPV67352.1 AI-2E family transporter [Sphingorhabdus lacus]
MNDAVAAKPRKARAPRKAEAPATDTFREEVGPTELYDPLVRSELKKAAVWIGMATLVVALIWLAQPILLIIGGLVLAAMFDGGARLLGRVLPIPRGFRLTIVVLAVFGFIYWTFVFTGSELASQAASLQAIVEKQIETIGNQIAAAGFNISADDVKGFGTQILNSVGRVTAAVSSVVGTLTNMAMMLVLAIFIAAEPRMYERGVAWMLPLAEREHFYGTAEKIGRVLRRLMAGRLLGMAVEGFGTWILLSLGGVPMAALLGILTGLLAFLPNIGAIVSGALIILVGFSAGVDVGLYAIFVYFVVQMVDGYLIVPMVAKRAVDLAPALVLGAQILFGALFGVLGLALADPIIAMIKVALERQSERNEARAIRQGP